MKKLTKRQERNNLLASLVSANFNEQTVVQWLTQMQEVTEAVNKQYWAGVEVRYTGASGIFKAYWFRQRDHTSKFGFKYATAESVAGLQPRIERRLPRQLKSGDDAIKWWNFMEETERNLKLYIDELKHRGIKRDGT